jgi:hypothetical protein
MGHPSNWRVSRNPLACAGHLHYDSGNVPKDIVNIQIQIGKNLLQKGQGGSKLVLGLKSQTMTHFCHHQRREINESLRLSGAVVSGRGPLVITAWEVV